MTGSKSADSGSPKKAAGLPMDGGRHDRVAGSPVSNNLMKKLCWFIIL